MKDNLIRGLRLRYEDDLLVARQQLRTAIEALGERAQDQTRWTTALSEVLRSVYRPGRILSVDLRIPPDDPLRLEVRVTVTDPTGSAPEPSYPLDRAGRLVDECIERTDEDRLVVTLSRKLSRAPRPTAARMESIRQGLRNTSPRNPYEEMQIQNEELLNALETLRQREQERRELLDAERAARAEAQREAQAREQILSVVSHDLNNPLSVILNTAAWLEATTDDEKRRKRIGAILRAGRRAGRLIEDLLDLSHIDAGRLSLVRREADLADLVRELAHDFRERADAKGIALEVAAPEEPVIAEVDPDRLLQVLGNLVSNAVKFTPTGGRVDIELKTDGTDVRISVTDDGPGIPAEHRDHVFDRFWQAETTRHQGSGLGLAIAEGIARSHGGRLRVDSEEGGGSRFTLHLPTDKLSLHGP